MTDVTRYVIDGLVRTRARSTNTKRSEPLAMTNPHVTSRPTTHRRTQRMSQRLGAYGMTALLAVGGAGVLARGCAPAPPPPPPVSAPLPVGAEVTQLVNQARAQAGLAPVTGHGALSCAANGQSADQATRGLMTHTGSNGSNAGARMLYCGFRWSTWGENVAYGQTSAQQVMTAWLNSPGHRANILNPRFTHIGVGAVAQANGTIFWTMDLAAP